MGDFDVGVVVAAAAVVIRVDAGVTAVWVPSVVVFFIVDSVGCG